MHRCLLAALLLVSMFYAQGATAQNLLTNPDFDTGTTGWTANTAGESAMAYWADHTGYPTAGSVALVAVFAGESASFRQCINITPQSVDAVAYSKVDWSGGGTNRAYLRLLVHDAPNCSNYVPPALDSTESAIGGGWVQLKLQNVALPQYTQSVSVVLTYGYFMSSGGVFMDRAAFGPTGTIILSDTVFQNGFE